VALSWECAGSVSTAKGRQHALQGVEVNKPPLLLEMVGICGAGKTTLEEILCRCHPGIRPVIPPSKISYGRFLVTDMVAWLVRYLCHHQRDRWFTKKEVCLMGYLIVWPAYICPAQPDNAVVTILNPGSVYWLGALRGFGPEIVRTSHYDAWWNRMLKRWAGLLSLIVWLDASDEVLLERVYERDHWHEVKAMPPGKALTSFARYRLQYQEITLAMAAHSGVRVLQYRTDRLRPNEIADRVLAELGV